MGFETDVVEKIIEKKKEKNPFKWIFITVGVLFVLFVIYLSSSFALAYQYKDRVMPHVRINGVEVGGLTKQQSNNIIEGMYKKTYDDGFSFEFKGERKTIENKDQGLFELNTENMVEKSYNIGRKNHWIINALKLPWFYVFNQKVELDYKLDKKLFKNLLETEFASLATPPENTKVIIKSSDNETNEVEIEFTEATGGESIDFFQGIENVEFEISNFSNNVIGLNSQNREPDITRAIAEAKVEELNELYKLNGITLTYGKDWKIDWEDYIHMVELQIDEENQIITGINKELLSGHIESIAQEIDEEAVNAKLQIIDNRVTEFNASKDGKELDKEESYRLINESISKDKNNEIELVVSITEPEVKMEDVNDLGIKEKIGEGISDFSRSPSNRRHNIGIGAASLHGVLLAPGEEFSLIKTLGDIDGASGYLQELVIKGGETKPEYGGGLCQVGTTIFRAALDSGLNITQRRNNSYRVSYYEPAGTDATIYDPWPDFRFVNDTAKHVIIQTKLWGSNLAFEIWGTDDGREVEFEGQKKVTRMKDLIPKIFNITVPGPAKEIETEELEPGEKKRMEYAHNGADTVFYQTIKYADGEEKKETWTSHYVPWQAVFMVGIDPEQKEKEAQEELLKQESEGEVEGEEESGGEEAVGDEE